MSAEAKQKDDPLDVDPDIALGLLTALERDESVTQRSLARELGIALGLTNAYLRRAVVKGWIKIHQVPPNRYSYYLTPKGFREKTRLTAHYLRGSFTFFRRAKEQLSQEFSQLHDLGHRRIVLIGVSELAEIATLCPKNEEMELIGIIDDASTKDEFAGLPVARRAEELPAADAFLITDLTNPQAVFSTFLAHYGPDRITAPEMLKVRSKVPLKEDDVP